jgi:pyruvate formate lyase activating enzyme
MTPSASPVYAYLKQPSMVDFPGHFAAVLIVPGCNFRCGFCHNSSLWHTESGKTYSWEQVRGVLESFRENWVDGVVISGGEPTQSPALGELVEYCKRFGLAVKLDTNGSCPERLRAVLPLLDYVAMDVKCALPGYPELTGWKDTDRIIESVRILRTGATPYEFRTTVIEETHTDADIRAIADLIRGARRYVLQPFVPREDLPDPKLRDKPRTSPDRMKALAELVRDCADEVIAYGVDAAG